MNDKSDTLFLRLAGPMQSWGTSSRFQLRRTDTHPSKSGVLGLILCAKGVRREDSCEALRPLVSLAMGLRVDRPGTLDWDYHTAGAKIGMRKAEGGLKHEGNKKNRPFETLLSRRQYLWDASFLVALRGSPTTVAECAAAVSDPVWPVFLGRKCCVPAEPVFAGTGVFDSLRDALSSVPWQPRIATIDGGKSASTHSLDCLLEHSAGTPPPDEARLVNDAPRGFGYYNHAARFVLPAQVTVPVGEPLYPRAKSSHWIDPYGPEWETLRLTVLERDQQLCVFCKLPAVEVHHLDYEDVRPDTLRSLCKTCHDACTMMEYGKAMRRRRIDPTDPAQRTVILQQIDRLFLERRLGRRRKLLEEGRTMGDAFFDDVATSSPREGR